MRWISWILFSCLYFCHQNVATYVGDTTEVGDNHLYTSSEGTKGRSIESAEMTRSLPKIHATGPVVYRKIYITHLITQIASVRRVDNDTIEDRKDAVTAVERDLQCQRWQGHPTCEVGYLTGPLHGQVCKET